METTKEFNTKFSSSILMPMVKGEMRADQSNLRINVYVALLGLIPIGKNVSATPLANISNVRTDYIIKGGNIIFAIFLFIVCSAEGMGFLYNAFLILLGLALLAASPRKRLIYENNGKRHIVELPGYESKHVEQFVEYLLDAINGFNMDRNVRVQNQTLVNAQEESTRQIVDAIKSK